MKHCFIVLSSLVLLVACNSKPQSKPEETNNKLADSLRFATDTAGLAEYQQWKAQHELVNKNNEGEQPNDKAAASHSTKTRTATSSTSPQSATASGAGAASSESTNSAQEKKGWSKTAKGAVIGGVVGAGTGAVVNKKNRVAGAVIGGAIGAGAGAVIGNQMDKKDGRH